MSPYTMPAARAQCQRAPALVHRFRRCFTQGFTRPPTSTRPPRSVAAAADAARAQLLAPIPATADMLASSGSGSLNLRSYLDSYGYVALVVGTFLEAETVLVLAGFTAHRRLFVAPW